MKIDEDGFKVEIRTGFYSFFIDEESTLLNKKYLVRIYSGTKIHSSLGKSEHEELTVFILNLSRINGAIVGVREDELRQFVSCNGLSYVITEFVNRNFLRRKKIMGQLVIFPTERLLENQKMPKLN